MVATDYDAPRVTRMAEESLEELTARHSAPRPGRTDANETEVAAPFEQLGGDQPDDDLTAIVIPIQEDEFRCASCFLVRHHGQRAGPGRAICSDCA